VSNAASVGAVGVLIYDNLDDSKLKSIQVNSSFHKLFSVLYFYFALGPTRAAILSTFFFLIIYGN
jgi:hypothetical protein